MKSKNIELLNRAQMIIPGGVNSPVRSFNSVGGSPLFIEKAKGAFIWDAEGNKYIDYVCSWGPMILGHSHLDVIKEIQNITKNGTSFGAPTKNEIILAEMIVDRVPGCEMIRMVNSGTEATMSAIRLARGITGRDKIIKFSGGYHGHSDSFLIESGSGALSFGKPNSLGVTKGVWQDTLVANFNQIQSIIDLFDKNYKQIAAVIVEPVNGNTGCIPPNDKFLNKLRNLCTKHDAMLIFDEVITGFRLARGGAAEYYQVVPDLYTFGKIIGGGLPVGAFGGKKELMNYVSPVGGVYQAGTLSGNPIAIKAGIETLKRMGKIQYVKLEEIGKKFQKHIQKEIDDNSYPILFNRVGSMFSIFFHSGVINNNHDVAKCDFDMFKMFFHSLLKNGIYIAPSQYEVGFLSLAHTDTLINITIQKIKNALKEIYF